MPRAIEMELNRGDIRAFLVDETGLEIVCTDGVLWITQTADSDDYILLPGERFTARQPCRVVVQGLRPRSLYDTQS